MNEEKTIKTLDEIIEVITNGERVNDLPESLNVVDDDVAFMERWRENG